MVKIGRLGEGFLLMQITPTTLAHSLLVEGEGGRGGEGERERGFCSRKT